VSVHVGLTRAQDRAAPLADTFGRAFVDEPMMRWPLGAGEVEAAERFTRCFGYFLEAAIPLGLIWEAGEAEGVAAWIPPGQRDPPGVHPWGQAQILAQADDGGHRYEAFWEWVAAHEPQDPLWQLDSIAVAPALQRRGIGRALIDAGLAAARADGVGAFLSTGTRANVEKYGRCGFRVYDEADAPGGGPHVWFMRWD